VSVHKLKHCAVIPAACLPVGRSVERESSPFKEFWMPACRQAGPIKNFGHDENKIMQFMDRLKLIINFLWGKM
jgi:hypothetical protein